MTLNKLAVVLSQKLLNGQTTVIVFCLLRQAVFLNGVDAGILRRAIFKGSFEVSDGWPAYV